jgi:hypothetical protein
MSVFTGEEANMRRISALALVVLLCVAHVETTSAQSGNASVGGFVQDPSQAFIPGVTVTATNTQTGVVTTALTNESGIYNITGLLPGTYKLAAELPGFKTQIFNDVQLGQSAIARFNFTLQVGAAAETIEVTAESTALITESSPTIGQVLAEKTVRDLPLVTSNVLDLMQTMAGVRGGSLSEATTFAGISTGMVNTVRDGLSVQNGRYANGVGATTMVHPDMVGEFRVILTPVDAELGRGNGQVEILTRSGTNVFHGSGAWSIRNSKLDANTWKNNKQVVNGEWKPGQPPWINRNEFTGSVGGPIVKNKTFFFTLFDKQFERQRQIARPVVLTDCARNGILRYWEGWGSGNTLQQTVRTGTPTIASVDSFGNPLRPATNPDGTPYTGQLRYLSVFGPLSNTPTKPDCSDAIVGSTPWDTNRTKLDPAGVSQKFLAAMPHANIFDGGDGLNTAVNQWVWRGHSNADYSLASGTSYDADRKQINAKIDHNFNSRHKVAVNYSYEWLDSDYYLLGLTSTWPGNYPSQIIVRPKVFTVNLTSTLAPSIVNEARYGFRESFQVIWAPWEVTDPEKRKVPQSFLLQGGQSFPIAYAPAGVGTMSPNNYFCLTTCAQQGNTTPLTSYADTLSWTKGKHAFKGGIETRFTYTHGSDTPTAPIPRATGGAGMNPNAAFANATNFPGLVSTNQATANSLLYFLSGSVDNAFQYYFIQSPNSLDKWLSYNDRQRRITEPHQNEFALFFKDNWKIHPRFTLNAGLRYEYYGVPYEGQGLTIRPAGGQDALALFGVSGRSFDRWMRPDNGINIDLLTQVEFVGPKTSKPDQTIYPNDWNNFGPAVGFAWELPWFGKGKTNVRGGYQISYVGGGHAGNLANFIFTTPGFINQARTTGPVNGSYFDVKTLTDLVPITPNVLPMQPIPLLKFNSNAGAFDPNFYTPYIQNFTLSVTRELARNVTLDVRYIGTRGIGLYGWYDLNSPDAFYNPTLFDALERTRRGENVALFDQMFLGLNLNPNVKGCDPANPSALCGPVDGITQRGSQQLRLSTTFRDALANGDYVTAANSLNVFNGVGGGAVLGVSGERGTVLRRANKGFNVPGGTTIPGGPEVPAGLFPENWIVANPQFNQANYWTNSGKSKYHSLQIQGTVRPAHGVNVQGTYIWSRSLETPLVTAAAGSGLNVNPTYTNPVDRERDYTLSPNHATHDFRSYGTFELPIGPGRTLFGKSSGVLARVIEGWQSSFIVNLSTGQPASITASYLNSVSGIATASPTGLYGNSVPDIVGPFPGKGFGNVQWNGNFGTYLGSSFARVSDPQCAAVAAELKPYCTLQAVTIAQTGQILLQNPKPGTRGTLGRQTIELPGSWSFDAALSKSIKITESKSLLIRMDSTNVFNHPVPSNPIFNINGTTPFGSIQDKGDQRRFFKGSVRLNF